MAWVKYAAGFIFLYVVLYRFFLNKLITGGVFDAVSVSEIDLKKCGY